MEDEELEAIPQDDLLDVMEMTEKLEHYISHTLKKNQLNLAMSALMSATINCIVAQCKTLNEVMIYKDVLIQVFDSAIRSIKIKGKE